MLIHGVNLCQHFTSGCHEICRGARLPAFHTDIATNSHASAVAIYGAFVVVGISDATYSCVRLGWRIRLYCDFFMSSDMLGTGISADLAPGF